MDEMMDKMDLNMEEAVLEGETAQNQDAAEPEAEIAAETAAQARLDLRDEKAVRQALEQARATETRAYEGMKNAAALTQRQKGVLELVRLEELDHPSQEQLDEKCKLILESYYLPHIAKDGFTAKLDSKFTRGEDPGRDYIEAVFTNTTGKTLTVGYNYKTDEDGKNILVFEKSFQNIILKPGEPEKYALYAPNGTEIESISMEKLEEKLASGEVVKVEQGYFQKAKDEDGVVRKGVTTPIVEIENGNGMKMSFGNNEQNKYTIGKNGQLTCATTNDVITANIETRTFSSGPIYDSADAAKVAAQGVIQAGEANPRIDISMEGTTVAEFSYLPTLKTSVELAGLARKLGKGMEGYDPNDSEGENLRRQFDKPIREYLSEKGYYVLDIVCENLMADVTENVGFMNTMKTYQITGGVVSVTYIKKHTQFVNIKQGVLGRKQGNNVDAIVAQLPEGSELLNPEDINWKNSKEEVAYVVRSKATGMGSAKNTNEADDKAAENAIAEAQKVVARSINGSIASGIKEVISGLGASSTVASVRARMTTAVVSKNDMVLNHKEAKYAYSGSCDKMVTSSENKLVSVTSWSGNLLTYVEAKEPVIDKGIPADENYEKYIKEGDDSGILLFERTDKGLRRYVKDVVDAQSHTKIYRELYIKARGNLKEMQNAFDRLMDERLGLKADEAENATEAENVTEAMNALPEAESLAEAEVAEAEVVAAAAEIENEIVPEVAEPVAEPEVAPVFDPFAMPVAEAESAATEVHPETAAVDHESAKEALLSIFGDMPEDAESAVEATQPVAEPVEPEVAPVFDPFAMPAETVAPAAEPVQPVEAQEPVAELIQPETAAVDRESAKEALLSIFGDMPEVAEPAAEVTQFAAETVEPEAAPVFDPFAMPATEAAPVRMESQPVVPAAEPVQPVAVQGPVAEPEAALAAEPVQPEAVAVDRESAKEALLSIFGDIPETAEPAAEVTQPVAEPAEPEVMPVFDPFAMPAAEAAPVRMESQPVVPAAEPVQPVAVQEPVAEPEAALAAEPVQPETAAVDRESAKEALLSIFGDMPEVAEPAAEPVAAPAAEPVQPEAVAVDHESAKEALLSIFGDLSEPASPAPAAAAVTPDEPVSTMPYASAPVAPPAPTFYEGESDMPVAPRPVTETRYERPEAPRTANSDLYVRPMPVISDGEKVRQERVDTDRPAIALDGTFVVPLPDMPDIQIRRIEDVPVGTMPDTSSVDAAWEQLMRGVSEDNQ